MFLCFSSAFDSQKGCQAATLSEYTQYLDSHCFDVIDPMYGDYSYKFAYPSALEYSKTGCKGHAQTVALPTTCTHASNSRRLQSGGASSSPVSPVRRFSDLAVVAEEEEEEEGLHVLSDDSVSTDVYEVWSQVHSHSPAVDPATTSPTRNPTLQPTLQPTLAPSVGSTDTPTLPPTFKPTLVPSVVSTGRPTAEDQPTVVPTVQVTAAPSVASTDLPTLAPVSVSPSVQPINIPTTPLPSVAPSGPSIPAPAPGPPANQLVVISVEQVRTAQCPLFQSSKSARSVL